MSNLKNVTISIIKSALAAYIVGSVVLILVLLVFSIRDASAAIAAASTQVNKLDTKAEIKTKGTLVVLKKR